MCTQFGAAELETLPRGQARVRSGRAAEPRQGGADARALRRLRRAARARRQAAVLRTCRGSDPGRMRCRTATRPTHSSSASATRIDRGARRCASSAATRRRCYGRAVRRASALEVVRPQRDPHYDPGRTRAHGPRAARASANRGAAATRNGQCLPFEPPRFGAGSTIGGTIAAGLAGPARVAADRVRDYVLGARLLTGDGRVLRFGGEVMKNVAGYDVSRLLAGSLGVLGVILDVSLKVLPSPPARARSQLDCDAPTRYRYARRGALSSGVRSRRELSGARINSTCVWRDLRPRLNEIVPSARRRVVAAEAAATSGATCASSVTFFSGAPARSGACTCRPLAPVARPPRANRSLLEWNGAQRWYADCDADVVSDGWPRRRRLRHAVPSTRTDARRERGVRPVAAAHCWHCIAALKRVFDPAGILNPGRMYAGL